MSARQTAKLMTQQWSCFMLRFEAAGRKGVGGGEAALRDTGYAILALGERSQEGEIG
jgi:hypothetical protein